jgi:hypothetical protein
LEDVVTTRSLLIAAVSVAILSFAPTSGNAQTTASTYSAELTTRWLFDMWGTLPVADVAGMGWETHPVVMAEYGSVPSWIEWLSDDLSIYQISVQGRYQLAGFGLHPLVKLNRFNLGEAAITDEYGNVLGVYDAYEQGITAGIGFTYKATPYTIVAVMPKVMFTSTELVEPGATVDTYTNTWPLLDLGLSAAYGSWIRVDASYHNIGATQEVYDPHDTKRVSHFGRFAVSSMPVRYLRVGFEHVDTEGMYLLRSIEPGDPNHHSYGAVTFTGRLPFDLLGADDGIAEVTVGFPVVNLNGSYPYDNGMRYGFGVAYGGFFTNLDFMRLNHDYGDDESAFIIRTGYELR